MKNLRILLSVLMLLATLPWLQAREPVGVTQRVVSGYRIASDCVPSGASTQLDINNVRALLHNGGDMWWDLVGEPRYEIPKGSNRNSLFAGSLWIGGLDEAGQLRVAAQTYRQSGNDFWPGPLTGGLSGGEASTEQATCEQWDEMFKISRAEIDAFLADYSDNNVIDNPESYPNVYNWPARGNAENPGFDVDADGNPLEAYRADGSVLYAAPFVDNDGDLLYDPNSGDYPQIRGDQAVWWVINDRGNTHTETGGQPIGVEIHMLAFAFTTSNAVNNMTFYQQTVINRSSQLLTETYIGQWVDADLGKFSDDYVGCDTTRGLGFCYNGDPDDDGPTGYGLNPPAVGVDFFQGPLADSNDGIDNDKDGLLDEDGETIIMSKFVYYNNDFTLIGNPEVAQHYYGYLTGLWKDGSPIVENYQDGAGTGNGYGASSAGDPTNYMFPGDPCSGTGWTESNADNAPADRRFLQSAGPFTLQPGAVNEIITGVVWARGNYQDQFGSVCELYAADDVAQALFDNDFTLLEGPDAPELTVTEYDSRFILTWDYPEELKDVRNNYNESYQQADPVLKAQGVEDSIFNFQGYIVYQLVDGTVGADELNDGDRARIVAQCDIVDGVSTIVNRTTQGVEGSTDRLIVDEVMVDGADEGIFKSVEVTKDNFATGTDTRLKNYSTYYYGVIAYAYNETTSDGRKFVPGNSFYQVVSAVPHPINFEKLGTVVSSEYGDEIPVTQLVGTGNGGHFLELTEETESKILENTVVDAITYEPGAGPIQVKVVDPKSLQERFYRLKLVEDDTLSTTNLGTVTTADTSFTLFEYEVSAWELYEGTTPDFSLGEPIYQSTYRVRNDGSAPRPAPLIGYEKVIPDRGISISVRGVEAAGDTLDEEDMGIIGASLAFEDSSEPWLTSLPDNDAFFGGVWNWLVNDENRTFRQYEIYDKFDHYSNILGGRWGPFILARGFDNSASNVVSPGVAIGNNTTNRRVSAEELLDFSELPDVDIVFTNDQTKWSRCVIVETSPNNALGTGAWPLSAKYKTSVDQDGQPETEVAPENGGDYGMGWFPGYAIDVNSGRRLNIFFGESEWDRTNRGNDMIWNPTSELGTNLERVGGRHFLYVTDLTYDGCESIRDTLSNANYVGINNFSDALFFSETQHHLKDVYKHVAWVGVPYLNVGYDIANPGDIPTEARVSLRLDRPFRPRARESADAVPEFSFHTEGLAVQTEQIEVAESALDDVLVVPNPYYAYASYESSQLDNRVRITNLPQRCRISIFTINGNLVRTYDKDSQEPFQDWNLQNQSGVTVASGLYIIHIDANVGGQNLGEKVVKLMAVMRELDLDNF